MNGPDQVIDLPTVQDAETRVDRALAILANPRVSDLHTKEDWIRELNRAADTAGGAANVYGDQLRRAARSFSHRKPGPQRCDDAASVAEMKRYLDDGIARSVYHAAEIVARTLVRQRGSELSVSRRLERAFNEKFGSN
jgi:hypothetical protein